MTIDGDDVLETSLLGLVEEEPRPPIPEEEATLLGGGARTSGDPGPAPQQGKNASCAEPAKQTNAPFTFIKLCRCLPWKEENPGKGLTLTPNNTSLWVSTYLKKDSQLPEWCKKFRPLPHIADEHCQDTQVQYLAHQQAVAFCLVATHQVAHSSWLAPPSLTDLKRKEYLEPKDPWLTQDFWEVWKEETVTLAIVLQKCAIWARAPPNTFCGAVQELPRFLALVMDKTNWVNMEEEIWAWVMRDPLVAASPRPLMSRRTQP